MSVIHYMTYNNYFNRTIKIENSYAGYHAVASYDFVQLDANFNPGNGIITTHVCGTYGTEKIEELDYVVIYSDDTYYNLQSRWFIIKRDRLRGGQWNLTLKRDVVADYYDSIKTAPAIIERAKLNIDNPLIFNPENFSFNQIKKDEILLKDRTKIPWIIAYIPSNTAAISSETLVIDPNKNPDIVTVDNLPVVSGDYQSAPTGYQYTFNWQYRTSAINIINYNTTISGIGALVKTEQVFNAAVLRSTQTPETVAYNLLTMIANEIGYPTLNASALSFMMSKNSKQLSNEQYQDLLALNGKIIKNNDDNKYYRVTVTTLDRNRYTQGLTSSSLFTTLQTKIAASGIFTSGYDTIDESSITIGVSTYNVRVSYEDITMTLTNTFNMSANRAKCINGMYDIIAIPCGNIKVRDQNSASFTTNEMIQKNLAVTLGSKLSGAIYDIQLLPYCPLQSIINSNGELTINTTEEGKMFDYVKDNSDNRVGIMFYVQNNSFTFNIDLSLEVESEKLISDFRDLQPSDGSYVEHYVRRLLLADAALNYPGTVTTNERIYQGNDINNIKVRKRSRSTNEILETFDVHEVRVFRTDPSASEAPYDYTMEMYVAGSVTPVVSIDGVTYIQANYYYTLEILPWNNGYPDVNDPSFFANQIIMIPVYVKEITPISMKIDSECDKYRLVSPNYQGTFEFCVARNGGVNYFNVDVTLKPFNPYIHVNPNFKEMYGSDFNDSRGLVCQGDFSYGQLTDRFQEYELNNKNYQEMFNRNIESMDLEHKLQKTEAIVGAIAGTAQGGVSGGMAGAMTGNPIAAAAGAIGGTVASAAGAIADMAILGKRQAEQKDLAIDMHEFQLGNIRALPYSLTRCPAFTFNNKLFPFIEKYSATDEEIKAFKEYLELRSFNVGVVGKIENYLQLTESFIKAQIIRFSSIKCDANTANEIYDELNKGVYIK